MFSEAVAGATPRWLIIPPIFWFAGYGIAAVISHQKASDFLAIINQHNQSVHMKWDPASKDILVVPGRATSGALMDPIATGLVESYGLSRAFVQNETLGGSLEYIKIEIFQLPCPSAKSVDQSDDKRTYLNLVDRSIPIGRPFQKSVPARSICEVVSYSRPNGKIIFVSLQPKERIDKGLLHTQRQSIYISDGKSKAHVVAGSVSPMAWFPVPVIGCGLVDSSSTWRCVAEFRHEQDRESEKKRSALVVIAAALGLEASKLTIRFPNAGW